MVKLFSQRNQPRPEALIDQWKRQAHALEFGAETELLTGTHAAVAVGQADAYRQCAKELALTLGGQPEGK